APDRAHSPQSAPQTPKEKTGIARVPARHPACNVFRAAWQENLGSDRKLPLIHILSVAGRHRPVPNSSRRVFSKASREAAVGLRPATTRVQEVVGSCWPMENNPTQRAPARDRGCTRVFFTRE